MTRKLPKMSKQLRQRWINACRELLAWYEKKGDVMYCPLCSVAKSASEDGCQRCLWMIFTEQICTDYVRQRFGNNTDVSVLHGSRNSRWLKYRIPQLKRWIKKLEVNGED